MTRRKHVNKQHPVPCTDANQRVREHQQFIDRKMAYARKLREKYMEEYNKQIGGASDTLAAVDAPGTV